MDFANAVTLRKIRGREEEGSGSTFPSVNPAGSDSPGSDVQFGFRISLFPYHLHLLLFSFIFWVTSEILMFGIKVAIQNPKVAENAS